MSRQIASRTLKGQKLVDYFSLHPNFLRKTELRLHSFGMTHNPRLVSAEGDTKEEVL